MNTTSVVQTVTIYPPTSRTTAVALAKVELLLNGCAICIDDLRVLPSRDEFYVAFPTRRLLQPDGVWVFTPTVILGQPLKKIVQAAVLEEFERYAAMHRSSENAEVSNDNR